MWCAANLQVNLVPGHTTAGSCEPGQFSDYYLYVDEKHKEDNLVIEVQDKLVDLDPTAISVYLYQGSIPSDRQSQRRSLFSGNHIYSVTVNMWDLKVGEYILSVR